MIVLQPYAGLSDRDGFDPPAIERLVTEIVRLNSQARMVVIGKNHERGCKYARECVTEATAQHPNVTDLIDKAGIRFCYHLVSKCDGFIGCHSNLIRVAWDFRRRNACVLPHPMMTEHLANLDPKYTYGFKYPETRKFTFPFFSSTARQFEYLDVVTMARFILGRE